MNVYTIMSAVAKEFVGEISLNNQEEILLIEKITNKFATVTQFLSWPILFFLFHFLFQLNIEGRDSLVKLKRPFIIISNHITFYDSFLFRLILGLWTKHLPLRFMAVDQFNWRFLNILSSIGVISFIYSLFGVFTVVPGRGIKKNLNQAKRILKTGGNIVIYPEGKITVENGISIFKRGAAVLALETGVPILPIAFKKTPGLFFRKKIGISIGKKIIVQQGVSSDNMTDMLFKSVSELYESIQN